MNWISVNEKLPKHHETVLAFTRKGQCVCIFVDTVEMNKQLRSKGYPEEQWDEKTKPFSFCSQEVKGNVLGGTTHWMPLPKDPK